MTSSSCSSDDVTSLSSNEYCDVTEQLDCDVKTDNDVTIQNNHEEVKTINCDATNDNDVTRNDEVFKVTSYMNTDDVIRTREIPVIETEERRIVQDGGDNEEVCFYYLY